MSYGDLVTVSLWETLSERTLRKPLPKGHSQKTSMLSVSISTSSPTVALYHLPIYHIITIDLVALLPGFHAKQ